MFHTRDILSLFATFAGAYSGRGLNHEGQPFQGQLRLRPRLDGRVYELEYEATGESGERFHQELGLLATASDGRLAAWLLSTNAPNMLEHALREVKDTEEGGYDLIFGWGDIEDNQQFRMAVTLSLHPGGDLSWSHAWGLPGGEFAARSGCRMSR